MGENNGQSNFEKWRAYTDGLSSPDPFIDFGYYSLISAALQRRVFLPPTHKPIFPNLYIVFVAPAGIGKGLVITEVARFLKHHKKEPPKPTTILTSPGQKYATLDIDRAMLETVNEANYESALNDEKRQALSQPKSYNTYEKPLLFPVAADATTYEALVMAISGSLRRKNYAELDKETGAVVQKIYTHSSMTFCLEELSSLFKKKAEDVVRFLQITFDCGDYKKDTKYGGTDRVKSCCVGLLGGATPEFMQRLFKDELADEGFASRTIFIYEPKDRKNVTFIPELNPYQKECEAHILKHIKDLSELYGLVTPTPEVFAFVDEWFQKHQVERPNINPKLQSYYARKKIHLLKLATAVHFGESTEMTLRLPSVERALWLLNNVERKMHYALIHATSNPYYKVTIKLLDYLNVAGPQTRSQLLAALWEHLPNDPQKSLDDCLTYCLTVGKVQSLTPKDGKVQYTIIKVVGNDSLPDSLQ